MIRTSSGRGGSSRPRSGVQGGAKVHQHPHVGGSTTGYGGGHTGEEYISTPEDSYDESTLRACVDECEKLVRDFNTRVAQYREKLIGIADVSDCVHFREDIRRKRRKGLDAAKSAKCKLFPHMRGSLTKPDFQRLFIQLTGCMHLFLAEMRKSLVLLSAFPIDQVALGFLFVTLFPFFVVIVLVVLVCAFRDVHVWTPWTQLLACLFRHRSEFRSDNASRVETNKTDHTESREWETLNAWWRQPYRSHVTSIKPGHPYENLPGMVMMMEIPGPSSHHDRRAGRKGRGELTVSEISDQLEESVILDGPMATSEDLQLIAKDMDEVRRMLSEVDLDEMIPRQRSADELAQVKSIHRQSSLVRLRRRILCCCTAGPKHIKP